MTSAESKVPGFIRNEVFYACARICMIASLPTMAFLGSRMITAADEVRDQVAKQNVALLLLASKVEYRFSSVDDHEQRLRKLEFGSVR